MAPHGIYPAVGVDRWLTLAVETDAQWSRLCAMAQEAWSGDARYLTASGRIAHRDALERAIAAWTGPQERDALVARLRTAGIPASPVQSIADVWTDAQFAARKMIGRVELPMLGAKEMLRAPWAFSRTSPEITSRGPLLGEHNAQVLSALLGLSAQEIAELQATGVVA